MQMIDVLKRLAQLDATTPAIDTGAAVVRPEQGVTLAECGPMGMMDSMGGMSQPHTPASINMTAATGDELSGMLKDIMSLAGINKGDADGMDALGVADEPMAALVAEPEVGPDAGAGPGATDGEVMRSVLDKLNPEDGEEADGEENPFGGDDQGADDGVSKAHGDIDNDGDHDAADHAAEKPQAGADDEEEETDETYDGPQYSTTPNDPNKDRQGYDSEGVGPNNHENQPGAGNTMFGKSRTRTQPTATYEGLMKEYKAFIGESEETDEDVEEGFVDAVKKGVKAVDKFVTGGDKEDLIKDLQMKAGVKPTGKAPEKTNNESLSDKEQKHAADTTMKHIKNPTAGEKAAAGDIQTYGDRAAMLRSAEQRGALKTSENIDMESLLKLSGLK